MGKAASAPAPKHTITRILVARLISTPRTTVGRAPLAPTGGEMQTAYLFERNFVSYFFLLLELLFEELEAGHDDAAADAGLLRFVVDGCTVICIDA